MKGNNAEKYKRKERMEKNKIKNERKEKWKKILRRVNSNILVLCM
jgi:hypothetical protein